MKASTSACYSRERISVLTSSGLTLALAQRLKQYELTSILYLWLPVTVGPRSIGFMGLSGSTEPECQIKAWKSLNLFPLCVLAPGTIASAYLHRECVLEIASKSSLQFQVQSSSTCKSISCGLVLATSPLLK